jgi:hypothetical protein
VNSSTWIRSQHISDINFHFFRLDRHILNLFRTGPLFVLFALEPVLLILHVTHSFPAVSRRQVILVDLITHGNAVSLYAEIHGSNPSRATDYLSSLRFVVVFLSLVSRMPESTVKYTTAASVSNFHLLTIHRPIPFASL